MVDDTGAPTVVLVDGSEVGWHALRFATRRAAETGGPIVCVAVTPPRLERGRAAHFDPDSDQLDAEFAAEVLSRAAAVCQQVPVEAAMVHRIGIPVTALADEARERAADCIVIGRRPRLRGFSLPDFAEQLDELVGVTVHAIELPDRPLPEPARPPAP
jgi:nucleotide-binding universal stress UspA family protein